MGSPTIKPSANIALLWGTTNITNNANHVFQGSLVDSLQVTPKNGQPIDIEGNAGFSAVLVGLQDGFDARVVCVYDSNKAYPAEGAAVALVGPKQDGNAGTTNYNCTFWSWGMTRTKKKEAGIEFVLTHRPDINGAPA